MVRSREGQANAFPLLEGESGGTAQDAGHWISVYQQLVDFCRLILSEDDVHETLDRAALRRRLRHFEARRAYWESLS